MVLKRSGGGKAPKPEARPEELADVLHAQLGALVIVDENKVVAYANPAAVRLLKSKPQKLIGQPAPFELEEGNLRDVDAEIKLKEAVWNESPATLVFINSLKNTQAAFHIEWRIESAEERAREAEEKIAELEQRLAELGGGDAPAPEAAVEASEELEAARAEIASLQERLTEAQSAVEELTRIRDEVQTELEQLRVTVAETESQEGGVSQEDYDRIKRELEVNLERLDETEKLLEQAEQKAVDYDQNASLETHQISTELQDALAQSRDLESQIRDLEERLRDTDERVQLAEEQAEEAEMRAYEAEGLLNEAESRVEEAEGRAQDADVRAQEAEGLLEDAENRVQDAQDRAEAAEARLGEVEQKLQDAEQKLEQADQQQEAAPDPGLQEEVDRLKEELEAKGAQILELEGRLKEAEASGLSVDDLESALAKLEEDNARLVEELEERNAELEASLEAIESLKADNEETENLKAQLEQFHELEADFQAIKEAAIAAAELEQEVEELRAAVKEHESARSDLEQEIEDLQAALEDSESELEKAGPDEDTVSRLKEMSAEYAELRSAQKQTEAELNGKIEELESELSRARSQLEKAQELLGDQDNAMRLERALEVSRERLQEIEDKLNEKESELLEVKRAQVSELEELEARLEQAESQRGAGGGGGSDPETERLAFQDALTGLPNVNIIKRYLDYMLNQAEGNQSSIALLLIDLDKFKQVNDALGSKIGDELLCLVAERFSTVVSSNDVLGRSCEDQFIILLSGLGQEEEATEKARVMARKVQDVLKPPFAVGDQKIPVGCSIGVSIYPSDSKNAADMLSHATDAMQRAKDLGRSQSHFYSAELKEHHDLRGGLEVEIRRGLEQREFQLVYQPVYDLNTGRIAGVESLVRWKHPERGVIGPEAFLQAAEETGLITAIGRWAIPVAIKQAAAWEKEGLSIFTSINLSKRQMLQADTAAQIMATIQAEGVNPSSLVLELSEDLGRLDIPRVSEQLENLRKVGVKFALDNFGTGHSSVERLSGGSFTIVKIDRQFTKGIPSDERATRVVVASIALAQRLGMLPVVVGVETQQQKNFLAKLHCDMGQGNLLSEPLTAATVTQVADRVSI